MQTARQEADVSKRLRVPEPGRAPMAPRESEMVGGVARLKIDV